MRKVPGLPVFALAMLVLAIHPDALLADIVTKGITVENDDAEEHLNTTANSGSSNTQGTMELTSSDLELGAEGNSGLDWQAIAMQYDLLGIPQGAIINSASIQFTVDNSGAAGTSNAFTIFAEAEDSASLFGSTDFDISGRNRSVATVGWAPSALPAVGSTVDTPDLTALIQEIVNRPGWSENNRLSLLIFPDVYLASPAGGLTSIQEIEFEAGPGSDSATLTVDFDAAVVPEPSSIVILGFCGLAGICLRRKKM